MCVTNIRKPTLLPTEKIVFKVVRKAGRHFCSKVRPHERSWQTGYLNAGDIQHYRLGEYATAFTNTPGFYCYADLYTAMRQCRADDVVLRVRIPPRTPFRRCLSARMPAVLAETIQPLEVVYATKN